MADQEFLASFAVDIDEAGVARLQTILSENRELAEGDRLRRAVRVQQHQKHLFHADHDPRERHENDQRRIR